MLPYCLFHEILHKSPMELNMTSMVQKQVIILITFVPKYCLRFSTS
ncbi:hypothetical protein T4B_4960 [Trichinella pseudospiralis]|uniref:Uncharacterized protein n=1 Tax=Trichinella pseudospiralis TaxID=6337 RepID=A0A0V1GI07_TRIPS|nr:hypothetical protein T4B_4960 [Trichinella pseudospiralis]